MDQEQRRQEWKTYAAGSAYTLGAAVIAYLGAWALYGLWNLIGHAWPIFPWPFAWP